MIEILVVIAVVGGMMALLGPRIANFMFQGKASATRTKMMDIKNALAQYELHMSHFPASSKGGLQALFEDTEKMGSKWQGPYLGDGSEAEVPTDNWGAPLVYNSPPLLTNKKFKRYELVSFGKNGDGSPEKEWIVVGE